MKILPGILLAIPAVFVLQAFGAPSTFEQAKSELRQKVYFDRNQVGDTYCGCPWRWVGQSGGRMDLQACGYAVRAQPERAARLEWEHVVSAWAFGHQRQCWQNGGRKNCIATDPVFRAMEADAHNLTASVGEVNGDRANFRFNQLSSTPYNYGACQTRVDFKQRAAEPQDSAKGMIARIQFYMHDQYALAMSRQQQQLFMAWDRQYPPSGWEIERNRRITRVMGHSNLYVTGERKWTVGQRPSGNGLAARVSTTTKPALLQDHSARQDQLPYLLPVIGNRRSGVFHMPEGCPSYTKVSSQNRVTFSSAQEAEAAGFRLAGNCRT
jgi:deoxyribonuclease-1